MSPLATETPLPSFEEFFLALHDREPFPWQSMLAARVLAEGWPALIDLPTASGKTACMDVALYALAAQAYKSDTRTAARRTWFVVDRRIIVDAAFDRAEKIAKKLHNAQGAPLQAIADRLRSLNADPNAPPLATARLRGGTWRDDGLARLPSQPAIICSTVDQLGSALLFRAYGHKTLTAPIWAGLAANDSLIILDEAHCAVPFSETLRAVSRFRTQPWSELPSPVPFHAVTMSATPAAAESVDEEQTFPRESERSAALDCGALARRTGAHKPAKLHPPAIGGRSKLSEKLAATAADFVRAGHRRIAVMVNRVASAQETAASLRQALKDNADVVLLTGRMRPLDRDDATRLWGPVLHASDRTEPARPVLVVATQCLEVGADFSFDALATECASLDALRQRFGRLNRLGDETKCAAAILIDAEDAKGKHPDPIYGEALAQTWRWLIETAGKGGEVDFGIAALDAQAAALEESDPPRAQALFAPTDHAPVLLPAHLDLLCQTGPTPAVEPEPALFLHGKRPTIPEARVVWRAALPDENSAGAEDAWSEILGLIPPSNLEALSVPLHRLRAWLSGSAPTHDDGDVEGQQQADAEPIPPGKPPIFGLRRANAKPAFSLTSDPAQIRTGDTVVLRALEEIPRELGQSPAEPDGLGPTGLDLAERATRMARGRIILRLQKDILGPHLCRPEIAALMALLEDEDADPSRDEIAAALRAAATEPDTNQGGDPIKPLPAWLKDQIKELAGGIARMDPLPGGGLLLTAKRRVRPRAADEDDADPEIGSSDSTEPATLRAHTAAVLAHAQAQARKCLSPDLAAAVASAAESHDLGKLDRRFQLILNDGDPSGDEPLAKSAHNLRARRRQLAPEDKLPSGFRHEMLSLAIAERIDTSLTPEQSDLTLHLIASHHGHARCFAPVMHDPTPENGEVPEALARYFEASAPPILNPTPAHHLGSGVAERFWRLSRRYGWWGLAYIEATLRLADWQASSEPGTAPKSAAPANAAKWAASRRPAARHEIELTAIDGANPLGFLAALGTLRLATLSRPNARPRLFWAQAGPTWRPALHWPGDSTDLIACLATAPWADAAALVGALGLDLTVPPEQFRSFATSAANSDKLAPFAAAFGSDACAEERTDRIQRTKFCFITGSGHQHFLGTIAGLAESVTPQHIEEALFGPWTPRAKLSMRWDPNAAAERALLARDPGPDGASAVWGADRLASEALPALPTAPTTKGLATVGFTRLKGSDEFTWPIWSAPLSYDEVAALLANDELSADNPERSALRQMGVAAVFRSTRVRIPPKGSQYKTSFRPARSV